MASIKYKNINYIFSKLNNIKEKNINKIINYANSLF